MDPSVEDQATLLALASPTGTEPDRRTQAAQPWHLSVKTRFDVALRTLTSALFCTYRLTALGCR